MLAGVKVWAGSGEAKGKMKVKRDNKQKGLAWAPSSGNNVQEK